MKMLLLLFALEHFIFCIPLFILSSNISKRNAYLNEYDFNLGRLNFTKILRRCLGLCRDVHSYIVSSNVFHSLAFHTHFFHYLVFHSYVFHSLVVHSLVVHYHYVHSQSYLLSKLSIVVCLFLNCPF